MNDQNCQMKTNSSPICLRSLSTFVVQSRILCYWRKINVRLFLRQSMKSRYDVCKEMNLVIETQFPGSFFPWEGIVAPSHPHLWYLIRVVSLHRFCLAQIRASRVVSPKFLIRSTFSWLIKPTQSSKISKDTAKDIRLFHVYGRQRKHAHKKPSTPHTFISNLCKHRYVIGVDISGDLAPPHSPKTKACLAQQGLIFHGISLFNPGLRSLPVYCGSAAQGIMSLRIDELSRKRSIGSWLDSPMLHPSSGCREEDRCNESRRVPFELGRRMYIIDAEISIHSMRLDE